MNDDELRDLVERHYQITDMQHSTGWQLLKDYVLAQVNVRNRHLLNGNAKTIEDYRADAGWIQGAMFVIEASQRLDEQITNARVIMEEEKAARAAG